jgi:putative ABC transport system ATP-binding protein
MQPDHTNAPVLEAIDVRKDLPFGRDRLEILKGVSFSVAPGEIVGVVGPSGSGKSTLLGIIAGLDRPTSGKVLVDGSDISSLSERELAAVRNAKFGMVFQAFNLIPSLTAQENVEAPIYISKDKSVDPARRARELLTLVGLDHRRVHRPHQLSGGEQQRVAIARALATRPPLIVMDEPTGNLDQVNSEKVLHLVRELRETTGATFLITTHNPAVAGSADRQIQLVDGCVQAISDVHEPVLPPRERGR